MTVPAENNLPVEHGDPGVICETVDETGIAGRFTASAPPVRRYYGSFSVLAV
jgi:hypothetical protein